ncbi:hypothetical protein CR513_56097, partial [Mucuna pruriens]
MRAYKEKVTDQQVVDKILRTLPPEFDYVAVVIKESKDLNTMEVEELQHSLEAHEEKSLKNKHFKHRPTTKETAKVLGKETAKVLGKGINPTTIRNTKIKNLVKLVNPLKKGGQTKHRSKVVAPKTTRSGSLTREK